MTILERESPAGHKYKWKDFMIVTNQRIVLVDMKAAPFGGWNIGRVTVQGEKEWPGMDEAAIVAWKLAHDDTAKLAVIPNDFRARLLAAAGTA